MPLVRSLASKRCTYIVAIILLFSKIMPTYFRCVSKGLIYIAIITPLGRQPSSYIKYTKSNIHSSCDVRLVSNTKCICFIHFCILQSLQLSYLICLKVSRNSYYKETRF